MITTVSARHRVQVARDEGDDGFSLLEVLVGMTILAVFLAIFGGSLTSMFNSVNRTQQTAYAQNGLNQLFIRLDEQVRYANAISKPASVNGDYVVEFVTSFSGSGSNSQPATDTCNQLRLSSSGVLQLRSWPQNSTPVVPSTPSTLARNVAADTPGATAGPDVLVAGPFALFHAVGDLNNQRLEIAVNVQDTREMGGSGRARHFDLTFTALNSGTSSNDQDSVCSQGRAIDWPTT